MWVVRAKQSGDNSGRKMRNRTEDSDEEDCGVEIVVLVAVRTWYDALEDVKMFVHEVETRSV